MFDQTEFIDSSWTPENAGLNNNGYIYTPHNCKQGGPKQCKLHVSFHGCSQNIDYVGLDYVTKTGYLEWAAANDVIVLSPQTQKNKLNGDGCWDFFGVTGKDYDTKYGVQPKAVAGMIDRVLAK